MLAPGSPGAPPSWGPGLKQAFGAAPGLESKVWFTLARGNLSEVFFPSLRQPTLHELRFLVAAPGAPPVDDAAEADHSLRWLRPGVPAFSVFSSHDEYHLSLNFVVDPDRSALLIAGAFNPELPDLRLYLMATPHVVPGSEGNEAEVLALDPPVLLARQGDIHIALVGPFARASAGYRDSSDLWVDLNDSDGAMSATYGRAGPGNVTLGAELALHSGAFQVAVAFAHARADAEEIALEVLRKGTAAVTQAFEKAWTALPDLPPRLAQVSGDGGNLARASLAVLRCLEDKDARGAFVAAPGAPWGELNRDGNHVYHLVWSRDLYHQATALVEAGDTAPAVRALRHLARMQRATGEWPQNWTLDGRPHWRAVELDEVALPVLLAWKLAVAGALDWDPYPELVRPAAVYMLSHGPLTQLDRWEDAGGLSPSTLAVTVSALIASAEFAHLAGDHVAAAHLRVVADYWADRIEAWCFSEARGHYVRLAADPDAGAATGGVLSIDFIELVRHGIRDAHYPAVARSLAAVDAELLSRTPAGPAWRRYVGDRYGEAEDGSPWPVAGAGGVGRPWPLLVGERAHLELLRGEQIAALVRAFEAFAGPGLMLPEQVWDGPAIPQRGLQPGIANGSAAPLGWAHAEYLKTLNSLASGRSGDQLEQVRRRCIIDPPEDPPFVWSQAHAVRTFAAGRRVKIQLDQPAVVRWSADDWATWKESPTVDTTLGFHVAELPTQIMRPGAVMGWTAHFKDGWEGRNHTLTCR